MNIIPKNIKQYHFIEDKTNKDYLSFIALAETYRDVKNYIYSRYHSHNHYLDIHNSDKNIRDVWTKNKFIESFGINKRYVRNVIEDACSNLKTIWVQTLDKVKLAVKDNKEISKENKHLINYILKSKELTQKCFNRTLKLIDLNTNKFNWLNDDNLKPIIKYINRIVRKHKPKVPYTKSLTIQLDEELYRYDDLGNIKITGNEKGKRLSFKINTNNRFKGTIKICFKNDRIVFNKCIKRKVKINNNDNSIGIDKNYANLIDTNTHNSYGVGFNQINSYYTNILFEKNKKRQIYHSMLKDDNVSDKKKNNIKRNNLGKVKYNNVKNKEMERIRKVVNKSLVDMFKQEELCELVTEKLNFTIKKTKHNNKGKKVNRVLSGWVKGYLSERIKYKCLEYDVKHKEVNAAYTSQTCGSCRTLGVRQGNVFYCKNKNCDCSKSKGVNAAYNAAEEVFNRKNDLDITIDMYPSQVKKLLQVRLLEVQHQSDVGCTEPTKTNNNV